MSKRFLKSAAAGKTWSFGFSKQPKRPAYWFATEGELEHTDTGFTVFKFTMFQARTTRQMLAGKATAKAKDAALATLIQTMKAEGLLAEEAA